ncbi:DinB family protein [Kitasatospora sp. DSM 101779]|uniref:DinB family protein n=1 Tax=Kitasatospora sp. DSM 101779 TaxID=2853165 RepID=UPI0021D9770A|nr:DinB family protein [Kitasatospora sp. DSM 101779]MCU7825372.1 DinB family protein [Kitasatospora sp. DSM 101779]
MPGHVPPVTDERHALLAYLDQQRQCLRVTAHGLTDEQATSAPSASELSIAGLIKHAARCERGWMDLVLQRRRGPERAADEDDASDFVLGPRETLAGVLADYAAAAAETDEIVAGLPDLGRPVPVPKGLPWFPADVEAWSVRWVLLHLIEETARHGGHADIIRETLDGATLYPLMAAAEQWPDPWFRPWEPAPVAGTA